METVNRPLSLLEISCLSSKSLTKLSKPCVSVLFVPTLRNPLQARPIAAIVAVRMCQSLRQQSTEPFDIPLEAALHLRLGGVWVSLSRGMGMAAVMVQTL